MIYIRENLIRWTLVVIALLFTTYGVTKALPYLLGPSLVVLNPHEGDRVASTTFTVSGRALRSNEITLQGKPITIDTNGYFNEVLVSYAPYTILTVEATDKYGKKVTKRITVSPSP